MSAPSQPTDSSRMKTDSTNSSSPGGLLSDGLHAATGTKPKVFDGSGPVGGAFTENGAVGGTAQKVGGPLDKDGMIGRQFTTDGAIGGTVQSVLGGDKKA
ncbi:hypothetical protein QBC34DRAFT_440354 [Podospora aff. communis PSN243]|uniref:Uncharacterized protein n=1 Tax=Podospora aff. communis PSN243 TaxID=3040156 RepID=A0AAV9GGT6_9PEZI|nr:hypothetical protein QBC34DRAFT_440354 [Podospora aff. communis PSN243]